jgi:hypothetical protein
MQSPKARQNKRKKSKDKQKEETRNIAILPVELTAFQIRSSSSSSIRQWIFDTGALAHWASDKSLFETYKATIRTLRSAS